MVTSRPATVTFLSRRRRAKQRVRVDVFAIPIPFRIGHGPDRKMQVAGAMNDAARVAGITDDLAFLREAPFRQAAGVTREMRVVVDRPVVSAHLINRDAAALALE